MSSVEEFNQHRDALFGLGYRMLGSVMDAEDIVQESFLHWQRVPQLTVNTPKAYLMTVVTRLCIDQLRLAHVRREEYVGDWLPEPLIVGKDPASETELAESISTAFLVLLERLAPLDRAILLLHDIFGYPYDEIGTIVGRNTADCRQIGHRARAKLAANRPQFTANSAQVAQVAQQFMRACTDGDMPGLLAVLTEDVTIWTDSGGKVRAALNPIHSANKAARFLLGVRRRLENPHVLKVVRLNGQMAVISYSGEVPTTATTFDLENDRIKTIYRLVNPDKLKGLPLLSAINELPQTDR